MVNPMSQMDAMKTQAVNLLMNIGLGHLATAIFQGFVLVKIPFELASRFKSITQRDIDLSYASGDDFRIRTERWGNRSHRSPVGFFFFFFPTHAGFSSRPTCRPSRGICCSSSAPAASCTSSSAPAQVREEGERGLACNLDCPVSTDSFLPSPLVFAAELADESKMMMMQMGMGGGKQAWDPNAAFKAVRGSISDVGGDG